MGEIPRLTVNNGSVNKLVPRNAAALEAGAINLDIRTLGDSLGSS